MKRKNKLILVLCCIPILVSCLVLPLCSFTTTKDPFPLVFKPRLLTSVGYTYHRVTATLDEHYYSYIPNINQTLAISMEFGNIVEAKNTASDYVIVGNTSINYNSVTHKTYPSEYSGTGDVIFSRVSLSSEDYDIACFNGRIVYDGLIVPTDSYHDNYLYDSHVKFYSGTTQSAVEIGYLYCYVDYDYIKYDGTSYVKYNDSYLVEFGYDYELDSDDFQRSDMFISLNSVLQYVLDKKEIRDDLEFISHIEFDFGYLDDSMDADFETIIIEDTLYNNFTDDYKYVFDYANLLGYNEGADMGFEQGAKMGFDEGYAAGKKFGLEHSIGTWSSLGSFLTDVVGSFVNIELWPNFSIGTLLSLIVGALLLITILRFFAGG